jgi:NADH:ubiquinone oxidoreductase subunit F (NADH-binding)/(2Fe-2S) ferredoxin/NAD-dependent dihydropyrimidine dehydrogenase PreA subunit
MKIENPKELVGDHITVGLATCGASSGALDVFDKLKQARLAMPIFRTGCIGMCHNEPIVTVIRDGKQTVYGKVTKDNVQKLIDSIKKDKICEELFICHDVTELDFYKKQKRLVTANCGITEPLNLEHYKFRKGYQGLQKALKLSPAAVLETVVKSGLRGRGGAGFPTGKKWSFIATKTGKKYLICNGDEGDPGAFMNRNLLESDPFKIVEGMAIGAYATGTQEGIIYARAEYPGAISTLQKAIELAYKNNLLGKDILGKKGFNFDLRVQSGAGAYVCGEETALIHSIEGKRGNPSPRPPFPAEHGIFGFPTVVNNVETWAQVSTLFMIGVNEYVKTGTANTKGTKTICLVGPVKRTGVIEVPFGISLKEIMYDIAGGPADGTKFKAVLSGGPSGGCIPEDKLNIPLDYETLQATGSIMGSGGLIGITQKTCMVDIAKYFLAFTQSESCGKCTPCREGTKRLLEMLIKISRGLGTEADLDRIQELAEFVQENSLCGLGQFAPNPVLSTLKHFRNEYISHIKDKKCPAGVCENLITYFITDKCKSCGNCAIHCPVGAISGSPGKMYVIDQKKCIKCGACYDCCAFKAIIKK